QVFVNAHKSKIHIAVGQINRPARTTVFFLHVEDFLVVLRGLLTILYIDRNVSDSWFLHYSSPFLLCRDIFSQKLSRNNFGPQSSFSRRREARSSMHPRLDSRSRYPGL